MKLTSAIAIYFIVWWTCLFVVLPFGVRNAAETGETVEEGNDSGAPVSHGLAWKAAVTTMLSIVVFSGIYWAVSTNSFSIMDIPFMPGGSHL